jgi:hypothetical protein
VNQLAIVPTDADFEMAFGRRFMGGASAWAAIKAEARQAAAERLLQENLADQRALTAKLPTLSGLPWMAEQERFDELMKRHDELLRVAFPSQFTEEVTDA